MDGADPTGWGARGVAAHVSAGEDGAGVAMDDDDGEGRAAAAHGLAPEGGEADAMETEHAAGGDGGGSGGDEGWHEREMRAPTDRPVYKLSVRLIDTYKLINKRYYEEKARRQAEASAGQGQGARQGGVHNGGYDDEHYDYIVLEDEEFQDRYVVKETVGRGSFGKVYKAWDNRVQEYVALKIIKSKRPFMLQSKTEIQILQLLRAKDPEGSCNCARLLDAFVHRGHQCLVFEMLSFNLYELLRSTQFVGVSLHLVRKFARHILRALAFLSRPDVDVIHCDLKPENILLQHPKRSYIKVIDFGSSCRGDHRMYSYIQSRFYRSPEVMLGLPYTCAIDVWSLGCILVELHTGEPLFAGSDQFDQMCRVVGTLGMAPDAVVEASPPQYRSQFFELAAAAIPAAPASLGSGSPGDGRHRSRGGSSNSGGRGKHELRRNSRGPGQKGRSAGGGGGGRSGSGRGHGRRGGSGGGNGGGYSSGGSSSSSGPPPAAYRFYESTGKFQLRRHLLQRRLRAQGGAAASDPPQSLAEILGADTGGPQGRRQGQAGHDSATYALFLDLITRMLAFDAAARIRPDEALRHPFLEEPPPAVPAHEPPQAHLAAAAANVSGSGAALAAAAADVPSPPPPSGQQTGQQIPQPPSLPGAAAAAAMAAVGAPAESAWFSGGGPAAVDNVAMAAGSGTAAAAAGAHGAEPATAPAAAPTRGSPQSAPGRHHLMDALPGVPSADVGGPLRSGGGSSGGGNGAQNWDRLRKASPEASAAAAHGLALLASAGLEGSGGGT